MNQIWFVIAMLSNWFAAQQPFSMQFAHVAMGKTVMVSIDGKVEKTFAGKMSFQDGNRSWLSVCADVRSPVTQGQVFEVQAVSSVQFGGNVAKAGNIVAKYFDAAQTEDQCAGLQLAVWKALEDGGPVADFQSGRFRASADPAVMAYAQQYYPAVAQPAEAAYLATTGTSGQSQLSSAPATSVN